MSKMIDETGNTYGYLTVLKRDINDKAGKAQWLCQCKCGNKIIVSGVGLRNGHTKSCGCLQKERTSQATSKNLIGKTIGNFTILEGIQGQKGGERRKWRCRCNLCGNENAIIATSNLYQQYSCGCAINSKGERKIKEILSENNINFIQEKRFADCVFPDTKKAARFDFYLPDYNILIEYDGRQHFEEGSGVFDNNEKFIKTLEHDAFKNKYCQDNNLKLIRIPYTSYEKMQLDMLIPREELL